MYIYMDSGNDMHLIYFGVQFVGGTNKYYKSSSHVEIDQNKNNGWYNLDKTS